MLVLFVGFVCGVFPNRSVYRCHCGDRKAKDCDGIQCSQCQQWSHIACYEDVKQAEAKGQLNDFKFTCRGCQAEIQNNRTVRTTALPASCINDISCK